MGLEEGGLEAGDVLATIHQAAGRGGEVVRVRRRQLDLAPGDFARLEALRTAASSDRNLAYTRALDHVVRAFDPAASPLLPPPLSAQVMHPGMLGFLSRTIGDRVAQALALIWEDGHSVWTKDAAATLLGAQPAATSNAEVVKVYEAAIGLLDLPRVPLFLRQSDRAPVPGVCLTWPAAALLAGRCDEDTSQVRFALGQALALTLPTNVVSLGLPEGQAHHVFRALMGAFGPPESSRAMNKESGRLAESLWHVLPPRTQRRLQALLGPVQMDDFSALLGRAWQSAHRVGLFLAGDFKAAVRSVLAEEPRGDDEDPPSLYGADWMALCQANPVVADLFRLAVSPEYAEARWRAPVHPARGTRSSRPSSAP